jgi:hypothetical protein
LHAFPIRPRPNIASNIIAKQDAPQAGNWRGAVNGKLLQTIPTSASIREVCTAPEG